MLSQTWNPEVLPQLLVHHGEKFTANPNMQNSNHIQFMEKHDSLDMDMMCVNPYDVMGNSTISADIPIQDDESSASRQNWDLSSGGESCALPTKVKLEMEEFSDLSAFLPTTSSGRSTSNSADELNTPVFTKEAFSFTPFITSNLPQVNYNVEEGLFKLEYNIYDNSVNTNSQFNDNTVNLTTEFDRHVHENLVTSDINNSSIMQNSAAEAKVQQVLSPSTEDESTIYYSNVHEHVEESPSPRSESNFITLYNNTSMVEDSALSVHQRQYSNVSSPEMTEITPEDSQQQHMGLVTPEDSNSSIVSLEDFKKKQLHLNINLQPNVITEALNLNTPDVIDSVVSLESLDFNILDLVDHKEIPTVNAEELFKLLIPTTNNTKTTESYLIENQPDYSNAFSRLKRPRKRKQYDDEDEDYVPPIKKLQVKKEQKVLVYESDSDDSDGEITRKPRGRPPKRTASISSDCSKDSDASKYRELRDKNNEASRKSRLKRKIKEIEHEKELDELHERNVKLKTQVEELEKMVKNFRDNLFKILIKK